MNIVKMTDAPYKYPSLTGGMLFRLWNAAIKDDDTLADEMIRGMYHCMLTFDRERAEYAMDLTVRRDPTARDTLRALLEDMQKFRGLNEVAPTQVLNPVDKGVGLFGIQPANRYRRICRGLLANRVEFITNRPVRKTDRPVCW